MDSYLKKQLKRKVSSFILSEAGKVGNRNTFSAAALVTASSLAAILLTSKAEAGGQSCGSAGKCYKPEICCKYAYDHQTLYWCAESC